MLAFWLCKVTCLCGLCSKSDSLKSAGKVLQSMPHPPSDPVCCRCCCCLTVVHGCWGYDMVYTVLLRAGPTEADGWSYTLAFPLGSWYTTHLPQSLHVSPGNHYLCCKTMCAPSSCYHHGCCCPFWLASCKLLSYHYCWAAYHYALSHDVSLLQLVANVFWMTQNAYAASKEECRMYATFCRWSESIVWTMLNCVSD